MIRSISLTVCISASRPFCESSVVAEEFSSVWEGVLSDPHGPFSTDQVEALAQIDEAASIWLSGWDAATLMLTGGNDRDN